MARWFATTYGALDVSTRPEYPGISIVLLPTMPSEPLGITGAPAKLWRRLLTPNGVPKGELSSEEIKLVEEFVESGIATQRPDDPDRVASLTEPWFASALHELTNSLLISLAAANSIRMMTIKGPTLERQDLRLRAHSGDVDAWVDPARVAELAVRLTEWGWLIKPDVWNQTTTFHSITLAPPEWGCEIDLHRRFPGVDLSDAEGFEQIWRSREPERFAGREGIVPRRAEHAVLLALHTLRPEPGISPRSEQDREVSNLLQGVGASALEACESLNAVGPLHGVLKSVFERDTPPKPKRLPKNWTWRDRRSQAGYYLSGLLMSSVRSWPKTIRNIVWPPDDLAMEMDRLAGLNHKTPLESRLARIRRLSRIKKK